MAIPTISDLVLYVNQKLTGNDWNSNWRKIINWFTDGKTDIKVKTIEISSDGGLINNGSIQQSGNFSVDGNITASGNITATNGVFTGDGSGLFNLTSAKMFPYVPWSINWGNRNSSGNGDLISATEILSSETVIGYTIDFKVGGSYSSIKATTASGEHFSIASLTADTISSANTSFFYFIKKGETFTTKLENIKIFRQKTAPTGDDLVNNYVWLDTSQEELVCKKYSSNDAEWQEWDYVPLGKVITTSLSDTPTITTFTFNQNEYSVNYYSQIFTDINTSVDTKISDRATGYPNYNAGTTISGTGTASSNGWIKVYGRKESSSSFGQGGIKINGVQVIYPYSGHQIDSFFYEALVPIKVNDTYELDGTGTFYPNR